MPTLLTCDSFPVSCHELIQENERNWLKNLEKVLNYFHCDYVVIFALQTELFVIYTYVKFHKEVSFLTPCTNLDRIILRVFVQASYPPLNTSSTPIHPWVMIRQIPLHRVVDNPRQLYLN